MLATVTLLWGSMSVYLKDLNRSNGGFLVGCIVHLIIIYIIGSVIIISSIYLVMMIYRKGARR